MELTDAIAKEIVEQLVGRFDLCSIEDVYEVVNTGSTEPSRVGDAYDDALTDAIQEQLDERGVTA